MESKKSIIRLERGKPARSPAGAKVEKGQEMQVLTWAACKPGMKEL